MEENTQTIGIISDGDFYLKILTYL
jgi:hypothetical protein